MQGHNWTIVIIAVEAAANANTGIEENETTLEKEGWRR